MHDMLRYHMGWLDEDLRTLPAGSGKAVRPSLSLYACDALGGNPELAISPAVSVELIHNFSLIHDDIQDGDIERRHRPTVWYKWGHSHGLNSGTAMNAIANLEIVGDCRRPLSPEKRIAISRVLTSACVQMIEGQTLDLGYEQKPRVSVDEYLVMIQKKTGALLETSLMVGALAATDDAASLESMHQFGHAIGRLFQVRDDMLGVWGNPKATGKPAASDLHRRKKSLPVVHALQSTDSSAASRFASLYKSQEPFSEVDIHELLGVMENLGSRAYCQRLAKQEAHKAVEALQAIPGPAVARTDGNAFVRFLLEREY